MSRDKVLSAVCLVLVLLLVGVLWYDTVQDALQ